ncbi:hypothetical protein [uncultured Nostoc sp.]|uniref:hypothetical protein n=1 Tax=uncultured Nostoc sp. TaxID=340711 RepID=UPI0035CAD230
MPKTREWFLITMRRFKERSTTTPVGNSFYTTVGRLVPITYGHVGSGRGKDGAVVGGEGAIALNKSAAVFKKCVISPRLILLGNIRLFRFLNHYLFPFF